MMCNFIVTVVMLMSNPTPSNTQGVLKVSQFHFKTFLEANRFASNELLSMGAGLSDKKVPRVNGVELQEMEPFKCAGNK